MKRITVIIAWGISLAAAFLMFDGLLLRAIVPLTGWWLSAEPSSDRPYLIYIQGSILQSYYAPTWLGWMYDYSILVVLLLLGLVHLLLYLLKSPNDWHRSA